VLAYLTDVRVASLTGEDAGSFKLSFTFAQNPFFSNTVRGQAGRGAGSRWELWAGRGGVRSDGSGRQPIAARAAAHPTTRRRCADRLRPAARRAAVPVEPGLVLTWPCSMPCVLLFYCFPISRFPAPMVAYSPISHFTQTLEKTFYMEDPDEVVPRKFVGTQVRAVRISNRGPPAGPRQERPTAPVR
jgi:hypothetical protein